MGILKGDLLGVTMTGIHVAGQQGSTVSILDAIDLTVVK